MRTPKTKRCGRSNSYDRVPLTVPKLEKELGKTKYRELLEKLVMFKSFQAKPTLAPFSDKREAIKPGPEASEDFK
ncbi:DUF2800 domain-containing protein [Anaerobacillus sp. HL2]|nr:DUF2800 domain-containing protein [Anaerobacillus sp. HL2]